MHEFTARFRDPVFIAALDRLRGAAPGPGDSLARARPSRTDVIRRLVFAAAGAPASAAQAPEAAPGQAESLAMLLDAWAAYRRDGATQPLTTHMVVSARPPAIVAALDALGHPDALLTPRALGQTLRHIADMRAPDGRYLARSHGACGRSIWYVVQGPVPATRRPVEASTAGGRALAPGRPCGG